jgi:hypothetical protein
MFNLPKVESQQQPVHLFNLFQNKWVFLFSYSGLYLLFSVNVFIDIHIIIFTRIYFETECHYWELRKIKYLLYHNIIHYYCYYYINIGISKWNTIFTSTIIIISKHFIMNVQLHLQYIVYLFNIQYSFRRCKADPSSTYRMSKRRIAHCI